MSPSLNIQDVHRPDTIEEAVALARRAQPVTAILGGGTWLAGEAPDGIQALVDISRLGLNRIQREANLLSIGAAVTLQALVEGACDLALAPEPVRDILATTAHAMAGLNIRNQATLGGTIVTADAASPLVTALLACDAELVVHTDERRSVSLAAFLAYRERILSGGALISSLQLVLPGEDVHFAYQRVARTPRDYPIVCAVVRCAVKDGVVGNVRVAVGGVAPTPMRLTDVELGLEKKPLAEHLERVLTPAIAALAPVGDWLGSAEYRREMAGVLVRRALTNAAYGRPPSRG